MNTGNSEIDPLAYFSELAARLRGYGLEDPEVRKRLLVLAENTTRIDAAVGVQSMTMMIKAIDDALAEPAGKRVRSRPQGGKFVRFARRIVKGGRKAGLTDAAIREHLVTLLGELRRSAEDAIASGFSRFLFEDSLRPCEQAFDEVLAAANPAPNRRRQRPQARPGRMTQDPGHDAK